jgi:hypothetical protein
MAKKTKKKAKKGTLFGKPRNQVIKHPGAFTAKAKKAGKTVAQMAANPGKNASPQTKKQAALAKAFATMRMKRGQK